MTLQDRRKLKKLKAEHSGIQLQPGDQAPREVAQGSDVNIIQPEHPTTTEATSTGAQHVTPSSVLDIEDDDSFLLNIPHSTM